MKAWKLAAAMLAAGVTAACSSAAAATTAAPAGAVKAAEVRACKALSAWTMTGSGFVYENPIRSTLLTDAAGTPLETDLKAWIHATSAMRGNAGDLGSKVYADCSAVGVQVIP
jgi:hypothetical protein